MKRHQRQLATLLSPGCCSRAGIGLVEIVIASACFLIAAIPIIGIFSVNMENTKVIHARAITYTQAQEILEQVYSMPYEDLPAQEDIDLPASGGTVELVAGHPNTKLVLTGLTSEFFRHLFLRKISGTARGEIRVRVTSTTQPRADVELVRTLADRGPGGGRK